MEDLPQAVVTAHKNFLNCVSTLDKVRKNIITLSSDVANHSAIRCKLRTHARLMVSYGKQVEKYWSLIEEDAEYIDLQTEFFQVTESVDEAELYMHSQLTDFQKSFDSEASTASEGDASTERKDIIPKSDVVNDGATTSKYTGPVTTAENINIHTASSEPVPTTAHSIPPTVEKCGVYSCF